MSKLLTPICAALLVAGLTACSGSGGNDDEARLNKAAALLDNGVYDTSPDDMALNEADLPRDEGGAAANGTGANAAAPAGNATGNAQ